MPISKHAKVPLNELWVEWYIEAHPKYDDSLHCYDFKIIHQTQKVEDSKCAYIPLLWLLGLASKYDWLGIMRNPHHIPKDPYEMVKLIKYLKQFMQQLHSRP